MNQIGNDLELGNDVNMSQSAYEKTPQKSSGWVPYIMSKVKWVIILILVVFILVFLAVYFYRRK